MRGMNIFAKIKSVNKKLLLLSIVLVVAVGGVAYLFKDAGELTKEQKEENRQILDTMMESRVTGGFDNTRLADIDASKQAGRYDDALKAVDAILSEPNLSEQDKNSLYIYKGPLCIKVKDFTCIDDYVSRFGTGIPYDYHYLIEAAELAKSEKNIEKRQKKRNKEFVSSMISKQISGNWTQIKTKDVGKLNQCFN